MRWMLPLLAAAMIASAADGQIVNPRITTDSSIDTSSAEAVVRQILKAGMTDEQKALACWQFMLDHFYHFYPPREPDTAGDSRDFQKAINSYGFGPCFFNAPVLTALWGAAGFEHRSWTVTGHAIPEVFYDDAWHMIDADARAFHRKKDGAIASVPELADDMVLWLKTPGKSDPFYPFGSPLKEVSPLDPWGPPSRMMDLYASKRNNYRYNPRAVNAHPMYLHLRPGETFTMNRANVGKYFVDAKWKPGDGKTVPKIGVMKRVYSAKGPWSVDGKVGYSNGTLDWQPDLRTIAAEQLLFMGSENVKLADGRIAAADPSKPAVAVFRTFCPYVLVEVGANMAVIGKAEDVVIEKTFDSGHAWQTLDEVAWESDEDGVITTKLDLTQNLRGRYAYRLRVTLKNGAAIAGIRFANTFQHSTLAMPKLKPGANKVTIFRGPDAGVVYITRSASKAAKDRYVHKSKGFNTPSNLRLKDHKVPGFVTWKLTAPARLVALSIGAEMSFDAWGRPRGLKGEWSIDGKNWTQAWYYEKPTNRGNASIERDVRADFKYDVGRDAYYKFSLQNGSKYSGITAVRLYAHYALPQPADAKLAVKLTWQEKHGETWTAKTLSKTIPVTDLPLELPIQCAGEAARFTQIVMTPAE